MTDTPKVVLVTAAGGGIGSATVTRLAARGHAVFAADRREGDRGDHDDERIERLTLDVTDSTSIDHAVRRVRSATSGHGVDVVINAAGILTLGPVEAVPEAGARAQFDVNVFGLLAVRRAFLPQMRERRSGRIVNVSSVLGRFALPGSGLYSASKFAG